MGKKASAIGVGMVMLIMTTGPSLIGQGLIIPGAGAVNRAMAGASTAAPVDPAGAAYWNPAAISGLPYSGLFLGSEFIKGDIRLASAVGVTGLSGETKSDSGVAVAPTIAIVNHINEKVTFGVGMFAALGGAVNFGGSDTNPILTPFDPPNTFGFGPQASNASVLQIVPILSYRVTDKIAIGGGPTIDYFNLTLNPAFFAPRNANGTFPAATNTKPTWGAGFQVGLFSEINQNWNIGLSYKSEQWFQAFEYNSRNEIGQALDLAFDLTIPQIISAGVAYKVPGRATIAIDYHYLDYEGTDLLGDSPAEGGVGWESISAVAVGAQVQVRENVKLMGGYSYNQNPVPEALTLFNVQLPAIIQHSASVGVEMVMGPMVSSSFTFVHSFENSIRGTVLQIPNSAVELSGSVNTLMFGIDFNLRRR